MGKKEWENSADCWISKGPSDSGAMNEINVWLILFPILMLLIAGFLVFYVFFVNVGPDEIAITERKYIGKELKPGRVFASEGEVGINVDYLAPGLHFVFWPFTQLLVRSKMVSVGANEIGLIEALDGEPLAAGSIYADDPAAEFHKQFQEPVQFLKYGGIRGKQLTFLTNGVFKIHPYLFKVTKAPVVSIAADELGIVEATDGHPLPAGRIFADDPAGESHDNFQKPENFLQGGGEKGPQMDFLRPGTYNINTEIFKVEVREAIRILENEIGIVEAKDGLPMFRDEVVVKTPENHNNFQDGQSFLNHGGKRGPQESVLTPGTYYINPYLFSVSKRKQTQVAQGEVAVMISNIGKDPEEYLPEASGGSHAASPRGAQGFSRHST